MPTFDGELETARAVHHGGDLVFIAVPERVCGELLISPESAIRHTQDPEPVEEDFTFPADVAAALNIYRHEEMERLRSGAPWVDADWATGKARRIADGSLDRKKQSGFYVACAFLSVLGCDRLEDKSENPAVGLEPSRYKYQ